MANATPCDADCSCPICWPLSRVREVYGKPYDDAPAWERDAAFDAAYEAYDCDNYPDAACEHEDNEPLFQALMDKVGSYHPEEESYQAEAYARAAEKIADLTASVFSLTDEQQRRLGVGPKTNQFIYLWICQKAYEAQKEQEQEQGVSDLEEEFYELQKRIQELVRMTKGKPAYGPILRSLDMEVSRLLFTEKMERMAVARK